MLILSNQFQYNSHFPHFPLAHISISFLSENSSSQEH